MPPRSQARCPHSPRSQSGSHVKIHNQACGFFKADLREAVFAAWNPSPTFPPRSQEWGQFLVIFLLFIAHLPTEQKLYEVRDAVEEFQGVISSRIVTWGPRSQMSAEELQC